MRELERFRVLIRSADWDGIEVARPDVRPEHVEALVQLYWQLDEWLKRVAVVQLVQDQDHPALRPIMLDVLRAPLEQERDLVELTKAAALGLVDDRHNTFIRFYEDRAALHAAVREVLWAHGIAAEAAPSLRPGPPPPASEAAQPGIEADPGRDEAAASAVDGVREAELRTLAEAGQPEAMNALGTLLMTSGRVDEAEAWYRRAAGADHRSAMYNLGLLLCRERRDDDGAEHWWSRAGAAGHVRAMAGLADLLFARGEATAAEPWYRRAAAEGDAEAMFGLAVVCADRGESAEALGWYERAAAAGDDRAMCNLAAHHYLGDVDTALRWWRRAADAGNARAMFNLAVTLAERGDPAGAEVWYRRAAEAGNDAAAGNLGILLAQRGEFEAAEPWLRSAAAAGNPNGMHNYGVLLQKLGRHTEAESWLTPARDAGP